MVILVEDVVFLSDVTSVEIIFRRPVETGKKEVNSSPPVPFCDQSLYRPGGTVGHAFIEMDLADFKGSHGIPK